MNFSWVLFLLFSVVDSAKILSYFNYPSISHQYVFQAISKGLSLKGHEVTFVTPNPIEEPELKNLSQIDVSVAYKLFEKFDFSTLNRDNENFINMIVIMHQFTDEILHSEMGTAGFQEILKKPSDYYDLILIEPHSPVLFGLQYKFRAPLIAISSLGVYSHLHHLFGNPIHPVLYPDIFSELSGPLTTFKDKFDSLYVNFVWWFMSEFYIFPKADAVARSYFGDDMPYIRDMIKKTNMLMVNANPIFSDRRPKVPNVKEYFNVHLTSKKLLPEDLQKILDDAENGLVYFSLGTNVRFEHLEGNIKEEILKALGDLPYTVLCKWESEDFPGKPKNVVLRKWLPQQSILAHSNVKVFVTQGGLQSSEEAIINGVPLVVIPFLGDQPLNAKILTSRGMAETISPQSINKDLLRDTILKVAKDEKYRLKAHEIRSIFLDQPRTGLEEIVWWCEYVIRHKGAPHLRSPSADISLFEYFMLDVIGVILIVLFAMYKLLRIILRTIVRLLKGHKREKQKND